MCFFVTVSVGSATFCLGLWFCNPLDCVAVAVDVLCSRHNVNILVLISIQNLSTGPELSCPSWFCAFVQFSFNAVGPPRVDFSYNIFLTLSAGFWSSHAFGRPPSDLAFSICPSHHFSASLCLFLSPWLFWVYFHLVVAADEGFVGTQAGLNIGEAIHISNLIFYFCCDIGVGDDQSSWLLLLLLRDGICLLQQISAKL